MSRSEGPVSELSRMTPSDREDRSASAPPTSQSRAILRDLLIVAAVGVAVWVAHRLGRIVLVLVLAMFLAYVIAPVVELLERPLHVRGRQRRLPRSLAIAVVYLLLAGAVAGGAALLWPSAADQIDQAIVSAPKYTESFRTWEHGWSRYYERLRIPLELRHSIDQSVVGAGDAAAEYARGSLLALLGALSGRAVAGAGAGAGVSDAQRRRGDQAGAVDGAAAPAPASRASPVRGAERDLVGVRARAVDRVRGRRRLVGRRVGAARQPLRDPARGHRRRARGRAADWTVGGWRASR